MSDQPSPALPNAVGSLASTLSRTAAALLALLGMCIVTAVAALEADAAQDRQLNAEARIQEVLVTKGRALVDNQSLAFRSLADANAVLDMQQLVHSTVHGDHDVMYGVYFASDGRPLAYAEGHGEAGPFARQPETAAILRNLSLDPTTATGMVPGERTLSVGGVDVFEASAPVFDGDEFLGTLRYGVSTMRMGEALAAARADNATALYRLLAAAFALSLLFVVLGIAIMVRRARAITRPLAELTAAARTLGAGDLSVRVSTPESSQTEIDALAGTFNAMAEKLSRSYHALEATNETLGREIEERRRAEADRAKLHADLVQAQKMEAFGQLAGGIAHDFNNLLAAVLGNAELIKLRVNKAGADPSVKALVAGIDDIDAAAKRGAALTRQLLMLGRREDAKPRIVVPADQVRDTGKLLRRVLEENITLDVQCDAPTPHVLIDPGRLEQVIMNLAINARDAMAARGGSLVLIARAATLTEATKVASGIAPAGSYGEILVRDTGHGMSPETLARVFEPFYTTKPPGKGTGLGLAIAYRILEQAGGFIDVESTVGVGTTFRVLLPETDAHQDESDDLDGGRVAGGNGEYILVCEDETPVRDVAKRLLEHYGYKPVLTATPSAALAILRDASRPIDLLLTDVVMPEMNGRELATMAHTLRPDLPVVLVSGYTAGVLADQGVEGSDLPLLRKPYSATELLATVQAALGERAGKRDDHERSTTIH